MARAYAAAGHEATPPGGLASLTAAVSGFLEAWPAGLVQLAARLWIGWIFLKSGMLKVQDFASAQFLFEVVHPVPFLPPAVAAAMATSFELVCPVLLFLGLATRLAALPMLGMALIIQFVVGMNDPAFWQTEHYYWMFLLAFLITKGGGVLSLDHLIERKYGLRM